MNFPTLETCREIGAEFPESEFVWANHGVLRTSVQPRSIIKEQIETNRVHGIDPPQLVANAPICEELGEWLHDKGYILVPQNNSWYVYSKLSELYQFKIKAPNETQARAEAVALLKKTKK